MNPNLELEEVIRATITVEADFGEDAETLATYVYRDIRNWMNRNGIVFYQP